MNSQGWSTIFIPDGQAPSVDHPGEGPALVISAKIFSIMKEKNQNRKSKTFSLMNKNSIPFSTVAIFFSLISGGRFFIFVQIYLVLGLFRPVRWLRPSRLLDLFDSLSLLKSRVTQ